jgi:hypothetical protein
MWKLFVTVLAMSDTGAINTNVATTDFQSRADCFSTAKEINGSTTQNANGHDFTIKVKAFCTGDSDNREPAAGLDGHELPTPPPGAVRMRPFFPQRNE